MLRDGRKSSATRKRSYGRRLHSQRSQASNQRGPPSSSFLGIASCVHLSFELLLATRAMQAYKAAQCNEAIGGLMESVRQWEIESIHGTSGQGAPCFEILIPEPSGLPPI
mmetsp:Transcript_49693/g.118347  ORF Transcript_49693/g.118347 Transcript_49693/m.118347 type:complete len:110 (-) Transcript_49693:264-593(-)